MNEHDFDHLDPGDTVLAFARTIALGALGIGAVATISFCVFWICVYLWMPEGWSAL